MIVKASGGRMVSQSLVFMLYLCVYYILFQKYILQMQRFLLFFHFFGRAGEKICTVDNSQNDMV